MRSTISVLFGRSVSGSWVAMNASSSSREASCSSVRLRSRSNTWHMRSRLNSTLSWSISSASRSTFCGVFCLDASSRITSPKTLRHQNIRRVTSCSEAARCAASSPKMCEVSRAESFVTSRASPAIQRATAVVELVQMRSKLACTAGSTGSPESLVRATVSAEDLLGASEHGLAKAPYLLRAPPLSRVLAGGRAVALGLLGMGPRARGGLPPVARLCGLHGHLGAPSAGGARGL